MDLGLSISQHGAVPVLAIAGEVDLATVPRLRDQLVRFVSDHPGLPVVADLDGGELHRLHGSGCARRGPAPRHGATAVSCTSSCSNPRLVELFKITGLDAVFPDPCHAVRRRWR